MRSASEIRITGSLALEQHPHSLHVVTCSNAIHGIAKAMADELRRSLYDCFDPSAFSVKALPRHDLPKAEFQTFICVPVLEQSCLILGRRARLCCSSEKRHPVMLLCLATLVFFADHR